MWFINLFRKKPKINKPETRYKTEHEACPFCGFGYANIYDQEYDCCFTCNRKWKI